MKFKRVLAVVVSVIMILGAAAMLASCDSAEDNVPYIGENGNW